MHYRKLGQLSAGFRRRREKIFGQGRCVPLDRNAKARIMVYARAWSARHRRPGQHRGPLTRATLEVLHALLWGFHNSRDGRCFPSYETIALRAQCCRATVYEAIKALEAADVLTWVNRLIRVQFRERDMFGQMELRSRLVRTSNQYVFRDPLPCAAAGVPGYNAAVSLGDSSKSENRSRTPNQDLSISLQTAEGGLIEADSPLEQALARLKQAMESKTASPGFA